MAGGAKKGLYCADRIRAERMVVSYSHKCHFCLHYSIGSLDDEKSRFYINSENFLAENTTVTLGSLRTVI